LVEPDVARPRSGDYCRWYLTAGDVTSRATRSGVGRSPCDAATAATPAQISFEGFIGGPKDDVASGNGKPNILVGLKGDDLLQGLAKPDGLFGGPGADDLFGGGGNDDLFGGPGADSCNVGPGGGSISSC
jgi:hypothetical protein